MHVLENIRLIYLLTLTALILIGGIQGLLVLLLFEVGPLDFVHHILIPNYILAVCKLVHLGRDTNIVSSFVSVKLSSKAFH